MSRASPFLVQSSRIRTFLWPRPHRLNYHYYSRRRRRDNAICCRLQQGQWQQANCWLVSLRAPVTRSERRRRGDQLACIPTQRASVSKLPQEPGLNGRARERFGCQISLASVLVLAESNKKQMMRRSRRPPYLSVHDGFFSGLRPADWRRLNLRTRNPRKFL